jgi:hypothetical protein
MWNSSRACSGQRGPCAAVTGQVSGSAGQRNQAGRSQRRQRPLQRPAPVQRQAAPAPHLQRLRLRLAEEAHVVKAGGAVEVVQRVWVGPAQQLAVQPQRLRGFGGFEGVRGRLPRGGWAAVVAATADHTQCMTLLLAHLLGRKARPKASQPTWSCSPKWKWQYASHSVVRTCSTQAAAGTCSARGQLPAKQALPLPPLSVIVFAMPHVGVAAAALPGQQRDGARVVARRQQLLQLRNLALARLGLRRGAGVGAQVVVRHRARWRCAGCASSGGAAAALAALTTRRNPPPTSFLEAPPCTRDLEMIIAPPCNCCLCLAGELLELLLLLPGWVVVRGRRLRSPAHRSS